MLQIQSLSLAPQHSYLASFRLPQLDFVKSASSGPAPEAMLSLIQKNSDPRSRSIRMILSQGANQSVEEEAGLKAELAASMWQAGKSVSAEKLANQSIVLYPNQWAAYRVKVEIMMAQHKYEEAYRLLDQLNIKGATPTWDAPLSKKDLHLCSAACAWRTKEWELVDRHLRKAFPKGVKTMPRRLQEDWFRLALYRHCPDDAAEAASLLVSNTALEFTDALLQTLVQQGWTEQALPLYRTVYAQDPRNQLLRRRLVALCIKEGEIEEARRLAAPGALDLNP